MAGVLFPERDYINDAVIGAARSLYRRFAGSGGTGRGVRRASAIRYKRVGKKRRLIPVPEIKYVDTTQATTVTPVGGQFAVINPVAEGTEYNTRVGRSIYMRYLVFDFVATPPTGAGNSDYGFIAIILDKQCNTNAPLFTDVFSTVSPFAMKNVAVNSSRFKILRRVTIPILLNTAGTGGLHQRIYMKLGNTKVQFASAASTVPQSNGVFLVWYSAANTGAAATSWAFAFNVRLAFCDV